VKLKTIYGRPRIDRLLGQCGDYPLTVIVAGAGYGKTTAVREFLKKSDVSSYACVTLTSSDEDVLVGTSCVPAVENVLQGDIADHLRILGLPASSWTRVPHGQAGAGSLRRLRSSSASTIISFCRRTAPFIRSLKRLPLKKSYPICILYCSPALTAEHPHRDACFQGNGAVH
jgi:hypothetical protein